MCFPHNYLPTRTSPKNAPVIFYHCDVINFSRMACVYYLVFTGFRVKFIYDCFVGCNVGLAARELRKADNLLPFQFDLLDKLHGLQLYQGHETLVATDDQIARLEVSNVGNALGDHSPSRPYSHLFALLNADLGNISILGTSEYTLTVRTENKAVVLANPASFSNHCLHCFILPIDSV